jgi:hypothetical protein
MVDPEAYNEKSVTISCHIGVDDRVFDIVPKAIEYLARYCDQ